MEHPTRLDPDLGIAGDGGPPRAEPARAPSPEDRLADRLWWAAGLLWRRKWWILGLTALVGAAAVAVTLQIPNRFRAETRVLLPDSGTSLSAAIGRSLGGAAALLGGGGGGYSRYIAILSSPATYGEVVDEYDLASVYETEGSVDPRGAAIDRLAGRTAFEVNLNYDYLVVSVLDEDPDLAAQMANTFVGVLNRRNTELNQESASTYRVYLEDRLERAEQAVDSLTAEMQAFQERYGVVEIEAQSAALMSSLADANALVATAEVEYEMLRSELGDDNPQTRTAAAGLAAARRRLSGLTSGSDAVMPVPIRSLPAVGRQFAGLQQGLLLQTEIVKQVLPLYEQALLTERRESDAVQVLDRAEPPARKAEPRRSVLVLAATLSGFLIAVALVLALAVARRAGPSVLARLRAA